MALHGHLDLVLVYLNHQDRSLSWEVHQNLTMYFHVAGICCLRLSTFGISENPPDEADPMIEINWARRNWGPLRENPILRGKNRESRGREGEVAIFQPSAIMNQTSAGAEKGLEVDMATEMYNSTWIHLDQASSSTSVDLVKWKNCFQIIREIPTRNPMGMIFGCRITWWGIPWWQLMHRWCTIHGVLHQRISKLYYRYLLIASWRILRVRSGIFFLLSNVKLNVDIFQPIFWVCQVAVLALKMGGLAIGQCSCQGTQKKKKNSNRLTTGWSDLDFKVQEFIDLNKTKKNICQKNCFPWVSWLLGKFHNLPWIHWKEKRSFWSLEIQCSFCTSRNTGKGNESSNLTLTPGGAGRTTHLIAICKTNWHKVATSGIRKDLIGA